jgi:hypothetical protein
MADRPDTIDGAVERNDLPDARAFGDCDPMALSRALTSITFSFTTVRMYGFHAASQWSEGAPGAEGRSGLGQA